MDMDMPQQFATLRILADIITEICTCNRDLRVAAPTPFDAVSEPPMSVHDYLIRIRRYTKFNFNCFLVGVWYLGKLSALSPKYCLTFHNVHRMLITAITVASKACDDVYHANSFMAQCGGIAALELNSLELEFCELLEWRLVGSRADLEGLMQGLLIHAESGYWSPFLNISCSPPRPPPRVLQPQTRSQSQTQRMVQTQTQTQPKLQPQRDGPDEAATAACLAKGEKLVEAEAGTKPRPAGGSAMSYISAWPNCLRRMNHALFVSHAPLASVRT